MSKFNPYPAEFSYNFHNSEMFKLLLLKLFVYQERLCKPCLAIWNRVASTCSEYSYKPSLSDLIQKISRCIGFEKYKSVSVLLLHS